MNKLLTFLTLCALGTTMSYAQSVERSFRVNNSPDGQSFLQVYLPAPDKATGRAVVACPGGGYTHLAMNHEGHDWATFFNARGIAYAVLTYRLPGGDRSLPLTDAMNALRTVRDSASRWHINPYDVGIMGSSAGGHLAATVSTQAPFASRPNFSILFYPVITLKKQGTHEGSAKAFLGTDRNREELVNRFSAEAHVRPHLTPSSIILLSNDDQAVKPVPNGVAYYTAMRRAGNNCALYVYPTGGHGWGYKASFAYHNQMLNDLSTWLDNLPAPSEQAVRVACIGNSITDGSGLDMQDATAYPAKLQKHLGNGYHVKNFGVSARTLLSQGDFPFVREMAWADAKAFNPNVVVIKLGSNDSKPFNWKYGDRFAHDLQAMVDTLRALPAHPRIILATPVTALNHNYAISDSTIVNGVIPAIRSVARKNKLEVVDLHTAVTDAALYQHDGIHPNEKGADVMATVVAATIKEGVGVASSAGKKGKKGRAK